ncbi:glutamine-synthetase adenylyltransferase [Marinicauda salina]|uniref:Glutamine-synthetase adenylyltransferase n=1 Tax=Marinicauda salina TaxID=2135793 RepID=A0A2U2BSR5_9PROT|nr:bifunctional [glutamine synthetase] adenylyltransferase/[glutamine synthetase]-adenylyl-L-tyrosine phosphorylase [Marinicauda salina]PWE17041.1 glutamine-synthetase adenylyltransferase [Marinicauda salina]
MTAAIPARITTEPPVCDPARLERARERVGEDALKPWAEASGFIDAVLAASPYLGRLAARRAETFARLASDSPEAIAAEACAAARAAGEINDEAEAMAALRRAKADLHLTVALADLAGAWDLAQTTRALSDFADAAVEGALAAAARQAGFDVADADDPVPGFFVLALGKMGARTLNFSSDIDLVMVWEPETAAAPEGKEPRKAFSRLAQRVARLIEEPTAEGYVFRVDLRLRPDPASTPPAVSANAARRYFEALGQNWERAAYAKARPCAGDRRAAAGFLKELEPFIWRRALDYEAVADIHALARQIQAVGRRARIRAAGHDLKLGRGGIREIEFYAQVMQLVFAGRRPELRVRDTVGALTVLKAAGIAPAEEVDALIPAYRELRAVEHRIQMLQDEQTQTLPLDDAPRAAVAALCGEADLARFDARMADLFTRVHAVFSEQFEADESLATSVGSLVLTGVEPTPDTLETLSALGFSEPERVWERLSGWAAGRVRAFRAERARALFSRLAPRLVEQIGATGDADATFARFAAFIEGLPFGVQPLALLAAEPELADELIALLALAPRLAEVLSQRPALLDIMLEPDFARPVREDVPGFAEAAFEREETRRPDFEARLNAARRVAREHKLRIGAQLVRGRATATEAGRAHAELADAAVRAMARAAEAETARRHGAPPGRWAVIGLGKFGGRELAADADLDLMVVYEPTAEASGGDKPVGAETWFTKFTQRLVSALSAPTEEGELYPVDMALRPSGSSGPIAVRLARFRDYYAEEAWTWERMAMTRARIVAHEDLSERLAAEIEAAIAGAADADRLRADATDMRARLLKQKPAGGAWDLKLREGGMTDIEFIAQTAQLVARRRFSPETDVALVRLADAGALEAADVEALRAALEDYAAVTQLVRVAHGSGFDPDTASDPFAQRLSAAAECESLEALAAKLDDHAARVRALFVKNVGDPGFGSDG